MRLLGSPGVIECYNEGGKCYLDKKKMFWGKDVKLMQYCLKNLQFLSNRSVTPELNRRATRREGRPFVMNWFDIVRMVRDDNVAQGSDVTMGLLLFWAMSNSRAFLDILHPGNEFTSLDSKFSITFQNKDKVTLISTIFGFHDLQNEFSL